MIVRLIRERRVDVKGEVERTKADSGSDDRNEADKAPPIQMVSTDFQNNTTEYEANTAIIRTNICFHGVRGDAITLLLTGIIAAHPLVNAAHKLTRRLTRSMGPRDRDVFFGPPTKAILFGSAQWPNNLRRSPKNH